MNTPNGKTTFKNLKVVISDKEMRETKEFCKQKGYLLSSFVGRAIKETVMREQNG